MTSLGAGKLQGHQPAIIAAYKAGAKMADLAKQYGASENGIRKLLRAASVQARGAQEKRRAQPIRDAICEGYQKGSSLAELSAQYKTPAYAIRRILRDRHLMEEAKPSETSSAHRFTKSEIRKCMCCGRPFKSAGKFNRLCYDHQSDGGAFA